MSTMPFTAGTCCCSIASIPWRRVTSAMPQPWQPPILRSITTASCTSISSTRPPWRATMGFTCSSNRCATRSYSVSSSAVATGASALGARGGAPEARAARIAWPTDFPTAVQGVAPRFTTVTRLPETITSPTSAPGMAKIAAARGEPCASAGDANRRTPAPCKGWLTMNLQREPSIGSAVILMLVGSIDQSIASRPSAGNGMRGAGSFPQLPRGLHHVPQRRQRLVPAPGLQAAIGVDPDLAVLQHLPHPLERRRDFFGGRHARRVDVVDPRADLVRVLVPAKGLEQLRAGARVLDRDHVRIHALDHADHVVELAVAHVRVNLGRVLHAARRQPKRIDGPVQVAAPVGPAERQTLAQRRLVDLDDADAGALEIQHLVTDRECELLSGFGTGLVVAHEGPLQDRDGSREHPLHGPVGVGLRERAPPHGHRLGARYVAVDDRRLHVAGAVGLHPAVLGEGEPLELLPEVLHHVVALELAVHEHVESQVFLDLERPLDLVLDKALVCGRGRLAV